MTRMEKTKAKSGKITRKNYMNKVYALALILGGMVSAVITDDATALVLIMFFVAPLFFTSRKIYTK